MNTLRRIGGPNAISAWTYGLTMAVFLVVTILPTERDRFIGPLGDRLLLAALGTLAGFAVLAVAWATVLGPGPRPSRPWLALAIFALAGGVQGAAVLGLRSVLGLPPVDDLAMVITRGIAGIIWLAFIAIVVDQVRSRAARVAELQARISAMEQAVARDEGDLRAEVAQMRSATLAPIHAALDEIGTRLGTMVGGDRAGDEALALRQLVDEQVRPLSHALLDEAPDDDVADVDVVLPTRSARLRTVARLAVTAMAAPAWLAVALPMILILLFAVQYLGPLYLVAASASYLLVVGTLYVLARDVLDRRLPRMRTWQAAACVVATYEGLAVVAVINAWAWGGLSTIGRWVEWPALVTMPVVLLALAAIRAGERERAAVEAQLEDVLERLAVVTVRRRQRVRHERQVLGRLLHGSAQAVLLSIATRLAHASDDVDAASGLDAAQVELAGLRARLAEPVVESWQVTQALDDVVQMWAGAVRVDLHVDDDLPFLLDATPSTRTGVIDVVAEGLTNAVRHGGARAVSIEISRDGPDRIAVTVRDDGRGGEDRGRGIGSDIFDEVACEWSLEPGADGSVLRAWVLVDGAPSTPDGLVVIPEYLGER